MQSDTYTISLWAQEHSESTDTMSIIHLQSAGQTVEMGSIGASIPYLRKTTTSLIGCVDSDQSINICKTMQPTFATLYNWTHYIISYCESSKLLWVCHTYWRGTYDWQFQSIGGNIITFDSDSIAYLGGSPYISGIIGKIVDARFYDTEWYTENTHEASNRRRCPAEWWNSCWGPDLASCEGLIFVDRQYSTLLDTSTTLNSGYLQFPGTDIKFKGHNLNETESSVEAWVYADLQSDQNEIWRFRNTVSATFSDSQPGDRIMTVFLNMYSLSVRTGTSTNWDFDCSTLSDGLELRNQWLHIGVSLSQTNNSFMCCLTQWGGTASCTTNTLTGTVIPFLTTGVLTIGSSQDVPPTDVRIVDFRFYPGVAHASNVFQERVNKASAGITVAANCDGSWGPDTWACNDYVQLTDPRFSQEYSGSTIDYTVFSGQDPRMANYATVGTNQYTVTMWIYRYNTATNTNETIFRAKHVNGNDNNPGQMVPLVYINNDTNKLIAKCSKITNGNIDTIELDLSNWGGVIGKWVLVNFSMRSDGQERIYMWAQQFSYPLEAANWLCDDIAYKDADVWDPNTADSELIVGDDYSWGYPGFDGRIVDARYYPNTSHFTANTGIMLRFTWVGGVDTCAGPDHTSITYLELTEKDYEYSIYDSGGEGKEYFIIPSNHVNFMKNEFGSSSYQLSVYVVGEDTIKDESMLVRFTTDDNSSSVNTEANKIPAILYKSSQIHSCVDTSTVADQCIQHSPMTGQQIDNKFYFINWFSVCGETGSLINWLSTDFVTTFWNTNSISSGTVQQFQPGVSKVYIGGDGHTPSSHLRINNVKYYPNSCSSDQTAIQNEITKTCDDSCVDCYGPGVNSCKYTNHLQILSDQEPWVGDGTTFVEKRGTDLEFEGRYMSYNNYCLSLWFYLNSYTTGTTIYLLALTSTQNDVSAEYRKRAPLIYIYNLKLKASTVNEDGTEYETTITTAIATQTWYLAAFCMEKLPTQYFDQTLYLGPWGAIHQSQFTQGDGLPGYFDSAGYFYYGGVSNDASQSYIDGFIVDIRYWDTIILYSSQVQAMMGEKITWHKNCSGVCTGPTSYSCSSWEAGTISYNYGSGTACFTTCPVGMYYSNDTQTCHDCDVSWVGCTAAGSSACTQCANPYFQNSRTCVASWGSGTYGDTSQTEWTCQTCNSSCQTCTGAGNTLCTEWNTGYYMQPSSTTCESTWTTPYITHESSKTCIQCDARCDGCTNTGNDSCIAWNSGYYRQPDGVVCASSCPADYVANAPSKVCEQCDSNWVGGCNGDQQSCTCADRFYLRDSDAVCVPCMSTWQTWTSSTSCTSCPASSFLNNGDCTTWTSIVGYGGTEPEPTDIDLSLICTPVCGDGVVKLGEEWDDGNQDNNDGCSSSWTQETGFQCEGGHCTDTIPPSGTLEYIGLSRNEYTLILYFTEEVLISNDLNSNAAISVNNEISITSWTIDDTKAKSFSAKQISVIIEQDVPTVSTLTLKIETKVVDSSGLELTNYEYTAELETKILIPVSQVFMKSTEVLAASSVAVGATTMGANSATVGSSGVSGGFSFLSLNPATFWSFVEVLQIINFMVYIQIASPPMLREFFRILGFTQGEFIPNVFEYFIEETKFSPPVRFAEEECTTNFILSGGSILFALWINTVLLGIFALLTWVKPNIQRFSKTRDDLMCAAPMRIAVEGFLDISLSLLLQFRNIEDYSLFNALGISISALAIIGYMFIIYLLFKKVIFESSEILQADETIAKYGALYEGYKTTHWSHRSFVAFEKVRKIFYVSLLVYLTNHPTAQIWILIILQSIWIIMNVGIRPFETGKELFFKLCMEFSLLIAFLLMASLTSENSSDEFKEAITWSIIGILGLLVGGFASYVLLTWVLGLIVGVVQLFSKLVAKIQDKRSRIHPGGDSQVELFQDDTTNQRQDDKTDETIIYMHESDHRNFSMVTFSNDHDRDFEKPKLF